MSKQDDLLVRHFVEITTIHKDESETIFRREVLNIAHGWLEARHMALNIYDLKGFMGWEQAVNSKLTHCSSWLNDSGEWTRIDVKSYGERAQVEAGIVRVKWL